MTTKREQILDQIKTVLTSTAGVSSRVYRSRVVPLSRGESPAIVIEPISDTAQQNTSLPTLDWSMQVRVSVIVRGDVPDEIADPIVESLHSKMCADLTLNGYAIDVQPTSVDFQMIDADQPAGVINTNWLVIYRTEIDDLTQ
tara:strand:+ start:599 stop:1024 length:426 start_codon:yes stop_codon:yes gene_type:complete